MICYVAERNSCIAAMAMFGRACFIFHPCFHSTFTRLRLVIPPSNHPLPPLIPPQFVYSHICPCMLLVYDISYLLICARDIFSVVTHLEIHSIVACIGSKSKGDVCMISGQFYCGRYTEGPGRARFLSSLRSSAFQFDNIYFCILIYMSVVKGSHNLFTAINTSFIKSTVSCGCSCDCFCTRVLR